MIIDKLVGGWLSVGLIGMLLGTPVIGWLLKTQSSELSGPVAGWLVGQFLIRHSVFGIARAVSQLDCWWLVVQSFGHDVVWWLLIEPFSPQGHWVLCLVVWLVGQLGG